MSTASIYRTIEIWRRHDDASAIRYFCLEDVDNGVFWIKSADHLRHPPDKAALQQANEQVAELALDSMIFEHDEENETRRWRSSIRAAIEAFDEEFQNK